MTGGDPFSFSVAMLKTIRRKWQGWLANRRLRRRGLGAIYENNLRLISEGKEPNRAW